MARAVAPGEAANDVVGGEDGGVSESAVDREGITEVKWGCGIGDGEGGEEVGDELAMAGEAEEDDLSVGLLGLVEGEGWERWPENGRRRSGFASDSGVRVRERVGSGFGFVSEHKEAEEEEEEEVDFEGKFQTVKQSLWGKNGRKKDAIEKRRQRNCNTAINVKTTTYGGDD